jgi:hypothetical protein
MTGEYLYHHVVLDANLASYIQEKLAIFIREHWSRIFYLSKGWQVINVYSLFLFH